MRQSSAYLPIPFLLPYDACYDYITIQKPNGQLLIFGLHFTWIKKNSITPIFRNSSIKHFPKSTDHLLSKCLGNLEKRRRHFLKKNKIKIHLSNSLLQPPQCHSLHTQKQAAGFVTKVGIDGKKSKLEFLKSTHSILVRPFHSPLLISGSSLLQRDKRLKNGTWHVGLQDEQGVGSLPSCVAGSSETSLNTILRVPNYWSKMPHN